MTTCHSDEDCFKQGPPRPPPSEGPQHRLCCTGLEHTSRQRRREAIPQTFDDEFDERFVFTGVQAVSGKRCFHPTATMIVNRGASDSLLDDELIPRLRNSMRKYEKLNRPKTIAAFRNEKVFATATGIIWEYIKDQTGQRIPVRISGMFVPRLGRNLFSLVKKAM